MHPLGKSPVITDGDITIAESGAIVDYIIRRYGKGAMMPAPGSADYEAYNEWLHYSEGSAMLPLMLNLYVSRLKEAGAPLASAHRQRNGQPSRLCRRRAEGREFFVGTSLTGADIQMSFVGEMAKVFGKLAPYPNLAAWLARMHARPAFQRLGREGRGVQVRVSGHSRRPGRERSPYACRRGTGTCGSHVFGCGRHGAWAPAQGRGDEGRSGARHGGGRLPPLPSPPYLA